MPRLNLNAIDPAELLPLPEVPESYGPMNEEDERVLELVLDGMASGQAVPVDAAFFAHLRSRISAKS